MFTGIITEIGKVKSVSRTAVGACLEVECEKVKENLNLGGSIAVNGVCLSAVKIDKTVSFDVVKNTFNSTNIKRLKVGSTVNLETALRMGDDLSGHIVSGHVDVERQIRKNQKTSNGWILDINIQAGDEEYILPKGSISIDGVSLTVGEIFKRYFRIFLIPHTLENTILLSKGAGSYVNLEFDVMSKYAEKRKEVSSITKRFLQEKGFM